ncbi:F-box/WD repeat-containing protein 4 isoform X7 [Festucalex cinctus]
MLLFQLPEDVLYQILSYLDCKTLSRLSQVSKAICHIVNRDVVWKKIAKGLLNTGITRYWTDIYPHILLKDRVKIAQNWCDGVCKRTTPLKWKTKLLPWLQLDGNTLFLSQAAEIKAYPLHQDGKKIRQNPIKIYSGHKADVCRFVLSDSSLISGGSSFVTGTACCENFSPLRIWDVERLECVCSLGSEFRRGAGVLDMVFETPFHLFTCGYDTLIRFWDLRLSPQKSVMEWEEPHDSALYCIQTDGNHMIASGSSYYGVVRLWDKRQTECLQFFQLSSDLVSSPVYCLRFSNSHLYAALATALHSLDFRHNLNITIR